MYSQTHKHRQTNARMLQITLSRCYSYMCIFSQCSHLYEHNNTIMPRVSRRAEEEEKLRESERERDCRMQGKGVKMTLLEITTANP